MKEMRLADFVIQTLSEHGVDTAFMVTGGMAMHLNDALALENRLRKICCHHEQACSFAAEAYAHVNARPALVQITSGPGVINSMTGIYSAFVDGLPMIVIAGQPKSELLRYPYGIDKSVRQVGEQESSAVEMANYICKYSVRILNPSRIRYELEKALHIATSGRPGPVLLEIPVDIQGAIIEPDSQSSYYLPSIPQPDLRLIARELAKKIAAASRPLLVAGPGLWQDSAVDEFVDLAQILGIPVVCAGVLDIVQADHHLYAGAMGAVGNRAGNINIQNADLILFLGVTMHVTFTTYNWRSMGKNAFKIIVEPDKHELERPQFIADESIVCRPGILIDALKKAIAEEGKVDHSAWLTFCQERVRLLPAVPERMHTVTEEGLINPYWFAEELFKRLGDNDIITPGNATAGITAQQAGRLRTGQRMIANFGCGSMGFGLPSAVGAALATDCKRRVICLEGDGSMMLNLQELATIRYYNIPAMIFIYNNGGYASVRQTQKNFFRTQLGYGVGNGLAFPNFISLAEAFGIPARRLQGEHFCSELDDILREAPPYLIEVMLDPEQGFEPKISSKRLPNGQMISLPPEDMAPFLTRDELQKHLLFPLRNYTATTEYNN